jgi:hypothetical protein
MWVEDWMVVVQMMMVQRQICVFGMVFSNECASYCDFGELLSSVAFRETN